MACAHILAYLYRYRLPRGVFHRKLQGDNAALSVYARYAADVHKLPSAHPRLGRSHGGYRHHK